MNALGLLDIKLHFYFACHNDIMIIPFFFNPIGFTVHGVPILQFYYACAHKRCK
jgi:hypothetical protein